jgi:hypothetical protein
MFGIFPFLFNFISFLDKPEGEAGAWLASLLATV